VPAGSCGAETLDARSGAGWARTNLKDFRAEPCWHRRPPAGAGSSRWRFDQPHSLVAKLASGAPSRAACNSMSTVRVGGSLPGVQASGRFFAADGSRQLPIASAWPPASHQGVSHHPLLRQLTGSNVPNRVIDDQPAPYKRFALAGTNVHLMGGPVSATAWSCCAQPFRRTRKPSQAFARPPMKA